MRAYVLGDIHGQIDQLRRAHALIAADRARTGEDAPIIHLGDLTDRGPASRDVIDYLLAGPVAGGRWITIRGNHDFMFRLFLDDPTVQDPGLNPAYTWLHDRLGGRDTLRSYGVDVAEDRPVADLWAEAQGRVPLPHRVFLDNLPLLHRTESAVFVHAGIRPGVPLIAQEPTDLMWIRQGWLDDRSDHGPLVVHGHTALDAPVHYGNRVNLDAGAGYGRPLVPAVVEGRDVWLLTEEGRDPLLPDTAPAI
ncbi:metallophosphoesterase [Rubellimicrobium roseum]|uniref:Serine/threonine protein phosphatase n=1 Tax=Rubellimicrobium roseum TaxID=687525 RepID=A0A5C4NJR6_9RHOB|nr:metallophosphoesterase [Rubellimicrobium roseum]TNC73336.1 serine/threonine protein phosphatase [Rubellimicrobium roseum]